MANSLTRSLLIVSVSVATSACATLSPPAHNNGPTLSPSGIEVAVLRQSCSQTQEPDEYGWDLVEATVEVQVRNRAPDPATVHRDRFHLLAPDGVALPPITWRSADPLTVAGGADQTFQLRFMTRGGLECAKEMRLDPDAGITLRQSPIALRPVSFTPRCSL